MGGEIEMEFVDVEGKGGFFHRDLPYQKVKTRSPQVKMDKAVLSAVVKQSENLNYKLEFRFSDSKAYVDKHYARFHLPSLNTRLEMCKNKPFIATNRRTVAYPLLGTAFWKGREYHILSVITFDLSENISLEAGASFAMKRPLGTDDAAEDQSFKMIVYGDYDSKDGQTIEHGGMLSIRAFGLHGVGWFYTGELIDDFDWKTQLSQSFSGYDELGDSQDVPHWWYGGRFDLNYYDVHLRTEFIRSQDDLLPRDGYYLEGSYQIRVGNQLPLKGIQPLIRHGVLTVRDHPELLGNPMTWDRTMTTVAAFLPLNDYVTLKAEYYFLREVTGDRSEDHTNDDQLLIQIEYQF